MELSFVKQNVLQRRVSKLLNEPPYGRQNQTNRRYITDLLENVNNKSPSAVWSGRKSCRVNMTVLLSFEEKTDDARACA